MKNIAFILACVTAMFFFSSGNDGGISGSDGGDRAPARFRGVHAADVPAVWYVYNASAPVSAENYVEDIDREKCSCRGIKLYGKVKIVGSFADLKVKVVESFPDLKVKTVTSFPDGCGKWQFVESFPDFTVQFVESFPDLKIKFVESFPGM